MFRFVLLLLVLVTMLFAQGAMAQDDGMMGDEKMDDSMKEEMTTGEFKAVISGDTARVRDRPSPDGSVIGLCQSGNEFTVWLPARGDWLASSCYGVNGFIHSSLIEVGEAVMPSDDAMMMDDSMKDDMMDDSMKDDMMDDSMKDEMMDDSMKDEMMDDSMKDDMMDDSMKDEMMSGEFSAVITRGPARIRAGASTDDDIVGLCAKGDKLTVWLPGEGDWLTASCHGFNGYIHNSLVEVGEQVIPAMTEDGDSDDMAMKDDMGMEDDMSGDDM